MAQGQRTNRTLVNQARAGLDRFAYETARELNINWDNPYKGDLASRDTGAVGGNMVKKMIAAYEQNLANQQPRV